MELHFRHLHSDFEGKKQQPKQSGGMTVLTTTVMLVTNGDVDDDSDDDNDKDDDLKGRRNLQVAGNGSETEHVESRLSKLG